MAGDELGYFIVAGVLRCTRSASKKLKLHHQTKQQMSRSPAGEDFGGDGDHITKQTRKKALGRQKYVVLNQPGGERSVGTECMLWSVRCANCF